MELAANPAGRRSSRIAVLRPRLPIRPLALNRKNALFAGSDEGGDNWAVIATLIENCKLSGINPHIWMTDTLARLANGHPANGVGELMAWTAVA
ncbi:hypothetical protein J3E64_004117 [Sphingobium sp. OAS761]|nr:hypothetical protein [Sphingobium sp. OAS761]